MEGGYNRQGDTSFTRLLSNVQSGVMSGSQMVVRAEGNIDDNSFVDVFGLDHEDDIDQSSEDEDVNEDDIARVNMDREAAQITPSCNMTGEPDSAMMNAWQTWIGMDPLPNQDEFCKGQRFSSLEELKRRIVVYSVSKGEEYKVQKARDRWYTVVCVQKDQGCTWKLSAHKVGELDNVWKISTYKGSHVPSCVRDVMHMDNRNVSEKFIAEEIVSLIRVDKALKPRTIMLVIEGLSLKPDLNDLRDVGRPGRRKESRFHNEMDIVSAPGKSNCKLCGQEGHNRRTCAS